MKVADVSWPAWTLNSSGRPFFQDRTSVMTLSKTERKRLARLDLRKVKWSVEEDGVLWANYGRVRRRLGLSPSSMRELCGPARQRTDEQRRLWGDEHVLAELCRGLRRDGFDVHRRLQLRSEDTVRMAWTEREKSQLRAKRRVFASVEALAKAIGRPEAAIQRGLALLDADDRRRAGQNRIPPKAKSAPSSPATPGRAQEAELPSSPQNEVSTSLSEKPPSSPVAKTGRAQAEASELPSSPAQEAETSRTQEPPDSPTVGLSPEKMRRAQARLSLLFCRPSDVASTSLSESFDSPSRDSSPVKASLSQHPSSPTLEETQTSLSQHPSSPTLEETQTSLSQHPSSPMDEAQTSLTEEPSDQPPSPSPESSKAKTWEARHSRILGAVLGESGEGLRGTCGRGLSQLDWAAVQRRVRSEAGGEDYVRPSELRLAWGRMKLWLLCRPAAEWEDEELLRRRLVQRRPRLRLDRAVALAVCRALRAELAELDAPRLTPLRLSHVPWASVLARLVAKGCRLLDGDPLLVRTVWDLVLAFLRDKTRGLVRVPLAKKVKRAVKLLKRERQLRRPWPDRPFPEE